MDDTASPHTTTPGARPQRIVIIGTTGTGKSTLAERLASLLDARFVELDALFHGPNWTPAEPAVFRARITDATATPRWTAAGNYRSMTEDILWRRADTIVWLDYAFPHVMWRLFWRTLRRSARNEELWNGNRERFREQFLSSDSLFNGARKSHWRHRREWTARLREPDLAHVRVVRVRSPRATEAWIRALTLVPERDGSSQPTPLVLEE
jgi:adenylate kinase family enzyme